MTGERGSGSELAETAWACIVCGVWALGCTAAWHLVVVATTYPGRLNEGLPPVFYASAVFAAIASARWAPRVPSSMRLLGIAAVAGATTTVIVRLGHNGDRLAASAALLALMSGALVTLRLGLDLFGRRWSAGRRRLAAALGTPLAVVVLLVMMKAALGESFHLYGDDRVIVGAMALLGLSIVPPLRFEVPWRD